MKSFIEEQSEENDSKYKPIDHTTHKLRNYFLNNVFFGIVFLAIFATVVPLLIYYFTFDHSTSLVRDLGCAADRRYRVPCGFFNITQKDCKAIKCCFDVGLNSCFHYTPSKYYYEKKKANAFKPSLSDTTLGNESLPNLEITIVELSETKVKIILHTPDQKIQATTLSSKSYKIITEEDDKLMVNIYRNTDTLLLTTVKGPLIASKDYWEWTFQLTTDKLFGLGETFINLDDNTTLTKVIYKNRYDHNTLPIFMAYHNETKTFHGLKVNHEGPLEVSILPSNLVILRTISGSPIELELNIGPTLENLYSQMHRPETFQSLQSVSQRALGIHHCREEQVENLKTLLDNFEEDDEAFSYDSDCIHNDLLLHVMLSDDDSEISRINDLVPKLLMSFPPQVPIEISQLYKLPEEFYYKKGDGTNYIGKYRGFDVFYPDYSHPNIGAFVEVLNEQILSKFNNKYGFTFTNSWPENEDFKMGKSPFPYMPANLAEAMSNTIPWNLTSSSKDLHLTKHNRYGLDMMLKVNEKIPLNFTLSFISDINTENPILIENINISWVNMKMALKVSLYNSLFSNPLISVPVCGSTEHYNPDMNEHLCLRWYIMAATMPLFRISSTYPLRDPKHLASEFAIKKVIDVLDKRKSLIPLYMTLLMKNEPIIRPMFYDFHDDDNVFTLDEQYMIGDKILVSQPMLPELTRVEVYLPSSIGVWYELWGGAKYTSVKGKEWITLPIVETDWISFIPAGKIIPLVYNENTEITLIVAMDCSNVCKANGELLWNNMYFTIEMNDVGDITPKVEDNLDYSLCEYITRVTVYGRNDLITTCRPSMIDVMPEII